MPGSQKLASKLINLLLTQATQPSEQYLSIQNRFWVGWSICFLAKIYQYF